MNHITSYPTGNCNLKCAYCFNEFHEWCRGDATPETMKASVDFLIKNADEEEKHLGISFFGGEPFLRLDLMRETCEYATEKITATGRTVGFTVTSNCTLIGDAAIELMKQYNINLLASIDGLPHADNVRYWRGTTESSCRLAFANVIKCKDAGISLTVRWTVSKHTLKYLYDDFLTFMSLGIYNTAIEFVYEEDWEKEDLELLEKQFRLMAEIYISEFRNNGHIPIKPFDEAISLYGMEEPAGKFRCGLGYFGVGIGTDGEIYPCHRFVARSDAKDWSLGNVHTEFNVEKRDAMVADWDKDKITVSDGRDCKNCPIKMRCPGGGCFLVNLDTTGNFYGVPKAYCDINLIGQRVANDILGILYGEKCERFMRAFNLS